MNPIQPLATPVLATPHSRLADLIAEYKRAHAEADAAERRLKAVKVAIMSDLAQAAPDRAHITTMSGDVKLSMRWVETTRLDTDALKRDAPALYNRFAKKSGHWQLSQVKE